jgi:adenosylmethionine-8-amino-7-oxononanoate aminotransferase
MIPLAATLATPEVFTAFEGDSKLDALLHGHSYTAHAVGCQVATTSLELYKVGTAGPPLPPRWKYLTKALSWKQLPPCLPCWKSAVATL